MRDSDLSSIFIEDSPLPTLGSVTLGLTVILLLLTFVTGCSQVPSDPEGTLSKIEKRRAIHVGVINNPPWAESDGISTSGIEPRLVNGLAKEMQVVPVYESGSEQELTRRLKRFELDLMIGGLNSTSPRAGELGFSVPHAKRVDEHGESHEYVLAVPPGENAWLSRLDSYLRARSGGRG